MAATKGNGLAAPHDQPVKTITKRTTEFIATAGRVVAGDVGMMGSAALVLQAVWLALGGAK